MNFFGSFRNLSHKKESRYMFKFRLLDTGVSDRLWKLLEFIEKRKKEEMQISDFEYEILDKKEDFFSDEEWARFWWPSNEELRNFWAIYQGLSQQDREEHLQTVPWDFESLFSEIGQGEYQITEISKNNAGEVCFYLVPLSFPFGGLEPVKGLLSVYGSVILDIRLR